MADNEDRLRHSRQIIHVLRVDGVEVPVSLATLVVVKRPGTERCDWEVVAQTVTDGEPTLGSNALSITVIVGVDADGVPVLADVSGTAIVARYVDTTIVWRGDGELEGFDESWLG